MFLTSFERSERLRAHVQTVGEQPGAAALADLARGDAAAMQSAWCGFVPLLAHPVMTASATAAMTLLDSAATRLNAAAAAAA